MKTIIAVSLVALLTSASVFARSQQSVEALYLCDTGYYIGEQDPLEFAVTLGDGGGRYRLLIIDGQTGHLIDSASVEAQTLSRTRTMYSDSPFDTKKLIINESVSGVLTAEYSEIGGEGPNRQDLDRSSLRCAKNKRVKYVINN